jgi:hypothetical protein
MTEQIHELMACAMVSDGREGLGGYHMVLDPEKFAELIIEETLRQVDERCYGRGENQWYYDDDKKWVRLHFGYGELSHIAKGVKK